MAPVGARSGLWANGSASALFNKRGGGGARGVFLGFLVVAGTGTVVVGTAHAWVLEIDSPWEGLVRVR